MLSVLKPNEVWLNASLEIWSRIRFRKTKSHRILHRTPRRAEACDFLCLIHKICYGQKGKKKNCVPRNDSMISKCAVTTMEILNKLCAVCLSFPLHSDVLSVKLQTASDSNQTQEVQMKIPSLIYRADVKHLRWAWRTRREKHFSSRFPYCKKKKH